MTGLYDGIGQLLALSLILLLVIPLVTVLIIRQMKLVKVLPELKRYLLYLLIYVGVAGITLLAIRLLSRMWHFQILACAGIIAGTYFFTKKILYKNK
jgi:hypothetical protein